MLSVTTFLLEKYASCINGVYSKVSLVVNISQQLCLGRVGQDCTENHTVTAGESCSEIAANAGIALSVLLANNPNVNSGCTNLHIPEVR